MRVLTCLSVLLIVECMGQVKSPTRRKWPKIFEKLANPWTPAETRRPEEGAPLRFDTRDLRAVCGVPNSNRIINGVEAIPHELPWVVALFTSRGHFCTASLISDQWVLTAAHCDDGTGLYDVILGAHDLRLSEAPGRLIIRTAERHVHPEWHPDTLAGDIALIKLPQPVDITRNIRPICLQNSSDARNFVGAKVQLAGWGKTSDASNQISPTLQKTEANVIENQICRRRYGAVITADIMCSFIENAGTCLGDSGSAMSIIGPDGRWTQIGVTSFVSFSGCESGEPNGFTRLRRYLPWIRSVTGIDF